MNRVFQMMPQGIELPASGKLGGTQIGIGQYLREYLAWFQCLIVFLPALAILKLAGPGKDLKR